MVVIIMSRPIRIGLDWVVMGPGEMNKWVIIVAPVYRLFPEVYEWDECYFPVGPTMHVHNYYSVLYMVLPAEKLHYV